MSKEFLIPGKIIYGEDAVKNSISIVKALGKKALIVTGKIVVNLEYFKEFTALLDDEEIEYKVFTEITDEPTDLMIIEGARVYKNEDCDFIIGVGGGSPLDAMKAIAVLNACGGKLSDYMGKVIEGNFPPMVAVPTTAGTGSEATQFTVITDREKGVKMLLKGPKLIPDLAIIDPEFSLSSSPSVTVATGLDALTHAVEAYTSRKAQSLTDAVSLSAIKRIFKYLPVAYLRGDNVKAREEMSVAALEAGMAINNASVTIVHGMSRPIGANFHVPHGISNAMLLKECLEFALDGCYEKFALLGQATGAASLEDDRQLAAEKFIKAIEYLCALCKVPSLEEYGVNKDKYYSLIDKMAEDALVSGSPQNTMKEITKEDIVNIYKRLYP